jgi:hypothetical protein
LWWPLGQPQKAQRTQGGELGRGIVFTPQVRAQVSPLAPELAETFMQAAQEIIDTFVGGSKARGKSAFCRWCHYRRGDGEAGRFATPGKVGSTLIPAIA